MARNQLIQVRRSPATGTGSWTTVNPVLGDGEIGFERDTRKLKIGDGVTAWTALGYIGVGASDTSTTSVNLTGGTAQALPYQTAAGSTAFLPIGSSGKVLQVDPVSGLLAWNLPKITDFSASTSAALAAKITDANGSGTLVFSSSPVLTTPKFGTGGVLYTQVTGANATTIVAAAGAASTVTIPAKTDTLVVQGDLSVYLKQDGTGNYFDLGANAGVGRGLISNAVQYQLPGTAGTLALTTVVNGYTKADGTVAFTGDISHGGHSLTSVGNLTMTGTLDTALASGLVKADGSGVLSGGNKASLTADVSGSLPVANGGTGGTDVNTARQGLRLFVQSAQPSSANIPGYTPAVGDLWLW